MRRWRMELFFLASMSIRYLIMLAKVHSAKPSLHAAAATKLEETFSAALLTRVRRIETKRRSKSARQALKKAARASFEFCLLTSRGADARPA